jgi:ribonuclease HII
MGYATARHRAALTEHGAAPRLHRMSFAPLRIGVD